MGLASQTRKSEEERRGRTERARYLPVALTFLVGLFGGAGVYVSLGGLQRRSVRDRFEELIESFRNLIEQRMQHELTSRRVVDSALMLAAPLEEGEDLGEHAKRVLEGASPRAIQVLQLDRATLRPAADQDRETRAPSPRARTISLGEDPPYAGYALVEKPRVRHVMRRVMRNTHQELAVPARRLGLDLPPHSFLVLRRLSTHVLPPTGKGDEVAFVMGFYNLRRLAEKMKALAETDELTGLYSRRFFLESLKSQVAEAKRYEEPLTLLLMDLDHFKRLNDEHGLQAGDQVLRRLSAILREETRRSDVPARYGGEELVVLLPQTDRESGRKLAERIRHRLASESIETSANPLWADASVGVASLGPQTPHGDALIREADEALYEAKRRGRGRVMAPRNPAPTRRRRPSKKAEHTVFWGMRIAERKRSAPCHPNKSPASAECAPWPFPPRRRNAPIVAHSNPNSRSSLFTRSLA
jgi:diguanylate cyclase (GGDEF)-like protein